MNSTDGVGETMLVTQNSSVAAAVETYKAAPTLAPAIGAWATFRKNWRLYVYEGILLACFMVSACVFTALMEYPNSPAAKMVTSPFLRRVVIGLAMGITAVILIYSPLGKRSGAHMNPAFTLGFLRLAKIRRMDALGYMIGQFVGGGVGVLVSQLILGHHVIASSEVNFIVTIPGVWGTGIAWMAEFTISFLLMAMVLTVNQFTRLAPLTGCFAGALIVLFVMFEAPLSGFSMNPARTFGSAVLAHIWTDWWIYFTAPALGMLAGIEIHRIFAGEFVVLCPKLNHSRHHHSLRPCGCLANNAATDDNLTNG